MFESVNDGNPDRAEPNNSEEGAKLEHFLTVSKIVEQKEVFEKRFNYRKVRHRIEADIFNYL